jgi:thioredoxin 1
MAEVSLEEYQPREARGNGFAGRVGRSEAVARRRPVVQILPSTADKERGIMASADVLTITDENFQAEVLGSDTPVLVDFWAAWCGPCRAIAPAVEELARQYKGKLKVGKLDIDAHQNVPQKYGIMSIPTLILFKNGQVAEQVVGAVPKAKLEAVVKKALPAI